jgi:acetyl-CoA acetyltransferase
MSRRATVAVAGIGTIGFGRFEHESVAGMANRAVAAALQDAGIERSSVDGLLVQIGSPRGLDYDAVAAMLGLNVRFASETWNHGRFLATLIAHGAMAIDYGLANYIVCLGCYKNSTFTRHGTKGFPGFIESVREGGGPHAETPYVGMAAPMAGAAMAARRYLDRYGFDREELGAVALAQRHAALKNPMAAMQTPLSQEQYEASRFVIEPLRLFDCSFPVDVGAALVLTSAERARELRRPPVYIRGLQGLHGGPNEFVFGRPGLGINQAEVFDYEPLGREEPVFQQAGAAPEDIQTLHVYDGFTTQVVFTLERFGFCPAGTGLDFVQNGRIELGGALPINTSGGHLSEGHTNGWGQTLEIVRQLRGEAGERQVPDVRLAQWATTVGDSVIYGNDPS